MKQFLYISLLAAVITGCSDRSTTAGNESTTTVKQDPGNSHELNNIEPGANDVDVDTLGMAEFLAMKAAAAASHRQSNRIQSNDITEDRDVNVDTVGFAEFKRLKAETASRAYEDSIRRAEIIANRQQSIRNTERSEASQTAGTSSSGRSSKKTKSPSQTVSNDKTDVASKSPAATREKKGWSKKAKGAVIGAATGAAAGAIINKKNRGVGGVIGGVIGAAAGYGIGRQKDKKDNKDELIKDSTDQKQ